jgi:hypothetical protein
MLQRKMVFVVAACVALLLVPVVQAVMVTVNDTDVRFKDDGFEDDTAGSGNFPNAPIVGTWVDVSSNDPCHAYAYVTNALPPASGSNCLILDRNNGVPTSIRGRIRADMSSFSALDDNVRLEFDVMLPSPPTGNMSLFILGGTLDSSQYSDKRGQITLNQGGNYWSYYDGAYQAQTSCLYTPGTWQHVVVDYVAYSAGGFLCTVSLTGGGYDPSSFSFNAIGNEGVAGTVGAFRWQTGTTSGRFYIDGVPEPASLILLGLAGLLIRRR